MANSAMFSTFILSLTLFHIFQLVQSHYSLYHESKSFNVLNYGAIGDGFSDDSKVCFHFGKLLYIY